MAQAGNWLNVPRGFVIHKYLLGNNTCIFEVRNLEAIYYRTKPAGN